MITGKRFVTLEEFDRFRRALTKGIGSASIQNTYVINNPPTPEPISSLYIPRPDARVFVLGLPGTDVTTGALTTVGGAMSASLFSSGVASDAITRWAYGQTQAVSGQGSYWRSTYYTFCRPAHLPLWIARIKTGPSVAAMRLWAGLTTQIFSNADNPAAPSQVIAFRYSSGVGGNFYAVTDDDATLTATDTGIAIAADSVYVLMIHVESTGSIKFYINGMLEHTATTNLPASTVDFGFAVYWATNENVVKRIYLNPMYLEQN